jgi:hypothetical protein
MARIYTRKDQEKSMKQFLEMKNKDDIVIFCHHERGEYRIGNKAEWTEQMKSFRKYRKDNMLTINIKNHRNPMIQGKQFYTLVVQALDSDGDIQGNIDPMGLAFDDSSFLVTGMMYAFRTEANRDMSYKYIMGLK